MIEIIDYGDEYADDFKRINMEWLVKYNLAESHDLEVINDPRRVNLIMRIHFSCQGRRKSSRNCRIGQ